MFSFIIGIACLIVGYFIYGAVVERIMAPDPEKKTPCYTMEDGVDYIPMPTWKVYLIQFLNIAGTGPIFGTIQGILFGPAAYFWIVLGCIFGGAVHDYMSGMISIKRNGASLPEIIGDELGGTARAAQRFLSLFLMILVVAVFVKTPAGLLTSMTGNIAMFDGYTFWLVVIFAYYLIAAILPINKVIGKVYPIFGVMLIFMAVCIFFGIFLHDSSAMPELADAFENHYPGGTLPLFPGLCITIACGAVSGFHATQSPMMARCLKNECMGRRIFYGAMITEGVMAMIWAAAAIQFASGLDVAGNTPYEKLFNAMLETKADGSTSMNPAILVNWICRDWLGTFGAILAVLGVVFAPITTGDTALRSARLIIADMFHIPQDKVLRRVLLCIPIFAVSVILLFVKFDVLWRYFAWFNQTFSIFTFFAITVYLAKQKKPYIITLIPGLFMMMVCVTYICIDAHSLNLGQSISYGVGLTSVVGTLLWFLVWKKNTVNAPVKITVSPDTESIHKAVGKVKELLIQYKVLKEELIFAELVTEEFLSKAINKINNGYDIDLSIGRTYRKTTIKINYRGSQADPYTLVSEELISDVERIYGPEAENVVHEMMRRSQSDRINMQYEKGLNSIKLIVTKSERAALIDSLIALGLGIAVGVIVRLVASEEVAGVIFTKIFMPLYSIFLSAIKMIMLPLVGFSLASMMVSMTGLRSFGKIGGKLIGAYLMTTIMAIVITVSLSTLICPEVFNSLSNNFGAEVIISHTGIEALDAIINMTPINFLNSNSAYTSRILQVMFIALFVGGVAKNLDKYSEPVTTFVESGKAVFHSIINVIMRFMPFAVFGAMANIVISFDADNLMALLAWVALCIGSVIGMLLVYVIMLACFSPFSVKKVLSTFFPVIRNAYTTASSHASMPLIVDKCEALGIAPPLYSFTVPFGTSVKMDGTCIFYVSAVLVLAMACGVNLSGDILLMILITAAILSMATPGVTGAAFACITMLLAIANVPVESIAIVLCFTPLIDPVLTLLNVMGNIVITTILLPPVGRDELPQDKV